MSDVLQLALFGLSLGSIYALGAVGVSLTFGILRFANFSHGALMTFGAYCALLLLRDAGMPDPLAFELGEIGGRRLMVDVPMLFLAGLLTLALAGLAAAGNVPRLAGRTRSGGDGSRPLIRVVIVGAIVLGVYVVLLRLRAAGVGGSISHPVGGLHLPMLLPALVVAALLTGGIAIAIDRILYRRLRRTAPVILLISSFGVALILRSAVQIAWGSDSLVYDPRIQPNWEWLGLRIKPDQITTISVAVVLVVLLYLFLQKTRLGKAMRAMSDDPDLAGVTGIDTERVVIYTWFIAGALAAAAGIFLAMDTRLNPLLGFNALLPIFAAALVGGIGRPYGAIAGGLVVGMATELSTMIIPAIYKPAVAFLFVVLILIVRPTGLFRGQ